ncbi:cutinase family protein [Nocardia sp. NPDC051570]|uniref:cutinase family protein n=1 Tax=Nocardia sp. NPDC051570 TaxID=3364324 RepID=UPI00378AA80C
MTTARPRKPATITGRATRSGIAAAALAATAVAILTPTKANADTPCSAVDLVVARGTGEGGELGAEVGDPLFAAVRAAAPVSVNAYRVDYSANLSFSVGAGSADVVDHIARQAAECPSQRFVLVGYSQGAAVVHTALGSALTDLIPGATRLPDGLANRIAGIELFGDLGNNLGVDVPGRYAARTRSFCRPGDPICWRGGQNWPAHIAYGDDIATAAAWITDQIR